MDGEGVLWQRAARDFCAPFRLSAVSRSVAFDRQLGDGVGYEAFMVLCAGKAGSILDVRARDAIRAGEQWGGFYNRESGVVNARLLYASFLPVNVQGDRHVFLSHGRVNEIEVLFVNGTFCVGDLPQAVGEAINGRDCREGEF